MNDEQKQIISHNLWKASVVVSILVGLSALGSAWMVIPHRVEGLEDRLERMEQRWEVQTQLLIRIDERVERMMSHEQRMDERRE